MLAATQLGLVPPEVKIHQDKVFSILKLTRTAWAPGRREYRSEDVRRIATSLNRSIAKLIDAIVNAADDPLVDERDDLTAQADLDVRELQKLQRALALPVEQSRKGATVDLPEFRSAIPAIMERVAKIWFGMNSVHDIFLSWISEEQAAGIEQGFQDVLTVVQSMPGAKSITFAARHRKKFILGAAAVVATGGAAFWLLRKRRSMSLQEPEELLPAELPPAPVGIHIFGHDEEDQLLVSGDPGDSSALHRVADLIAKSS
jgi:hypothetical protein